MKIGEFITGIAMVAFILSLCTIESLSLLSLSTMFISGAWVIGYSWWQEEERIERMKERER